MAKAKPNILLADIGDRLDKYLTKYSQLNFENKVYDDSAKKIDLTKLIPAEQLSQLLSTRTGGWTESSTLFEKFFDLSLNKEDRYSEYEQIIYRIPEAAQALKIYVDCILAPDAGDSDKNLIISTLRDDPINTQARKILEILFDRSRFYFMLPQIVYTTCLYGDSFIEVEPTSSGVRYILHTPKNCTILYDRNTDIEMGLLIKDDHYQSPLKEMVNAAYPSTVIDVPQQLVSIVSNKQMLLSANDKTSKFQFATLEKQMTELLEDLYKTENTRFRYISPHRYVRFPIFYNNNYYPYGTSLLDAVRSIAKQLLLIEAALAIYRATRTPLRSMWTVDVTGIPEDQVHGLLLNIMQQVRRQKIFDNEKNGVLSIDSIPEIMGEIDDIWNTKVQGSPLLEYQDLPVPSLEPYTNDADYFRKKLLSGLGIPPSYLSEETGGSTRALLTLEDVQFSRTIKRLQKDFNNSLLELANLCFALINKPQYINKVSVILPPPISVEANMQAENLAKRLDTADAFANSYPNVPKLWIMKNIIKFTDSEIQDMESAITDQKDLRILMDQEFTEDNESESSSTGAFSGGSSFGGGGDFDFGGGNDFDFGGSGEPGGNEFGGMETGSDAGTEAMNTEMGELDFG